MSQGSTLVKRSLDLIYTLPKRVNAELKNILHGCRGTGWHLQISIPFVFVFGLAGCIQGIGPDQWLVWRKIDPTRNEWREVTVEFTCAAQDAPEVHHVVIKDPSSIEALRKSFFLYEHHGMSLGWRRLANSITILYANGLSVEMAIGAEMSNAWISGEGHEAHIVIDRSFADELEVQLGDSGSSFINAVQEWDSRPDLP